MLHNVFSFFLMGIYLDHRLCQQTRSYHGQQCDVKYSLVNLGIILLQFFYLQKQTHLQQLPINCQSIGRTFSRVIHIDMF